MAEEAERNAAIRSELQKLGVAKVDLAYRAVRDDVQLFLDPAELTTPKRLEEG